MQLARFHSSARVLKNPYFFYDLQRRAGPPSHTQDENPNFKPGRLVFDPLADYPQEDMKTRVSRVFGSLGSREESRKEALANGITVAGIHVPARPQEPPNCCMSGCVNCVWELYKDEIEEYRHLRSAAREKLDDPRYDHVKWPHQLGVEPADRKIRTGRDPAETDVEVKQETKEEDEDDLDEGIKVFIATEKRLHEKRKRLQQQGAAQEL